MRRKLKTTKMEARLQSDVAEDPGPDPWRDNLNQDTEDVAEELRAYLAEVSDVVVSKCGRAVLHGRPSGGPTRLRE